jgi:hypothetical protein
MATPPDYFACELTGRRSFACEKLRASISVETCRSNFTGGRLVSCKGCALGLLHSGKSKLVHEDRHARSAAKNSQPCIRCLRGPADSKTVCQHRLIRSCWCPSCDMRSRECVRNGGLGAINSKGTASTKHRSLRAATVIVLMSDCKLLELRPMVFADTREILRYLDRLHDGWSAAEVRHTDGEFDFLEGECA